MYDVAVTVMGCAEQAPMVVPLSLNETVSVPSGAMASGLGKVIAAVYVTGLLSVGDAGLAVTLTVELALETVTVAGVLAGLELYDVLPR